MNRSKRVLIILVSVLAITALGSGIGASQTEQTYAIEQGERCIEISPLTYQDQSVEAFYGYSANGTGTDIEFSANTPLNIEDVNDNTSSMFLYDGPEGLSLVFLHGAPDGTGGGAASFEFVGLPSDGEWVVKDDPTNLSVEGWNQTTVERNGTADIHIVDWGWQNKYTDGGAFQGGLDDQFDIQISPAFNENANVEPLTPGNVTQWRALTQERQSLEAVELDMNQPLRLRSGTCA